MAKFLRLSEVALISALLLTFGFTGCTPKPSNEEMGKLEESRAAAESAERKLSQLRMERMGLEKELEGSQTQEQTEEQELEEIQEENP
jgi:hypothetical protein